MGAATVEPSCTDKGQRNAVEEAVLKAPTSAVSLALNARLASTRHMVLLAKLLIVAWVVACVWSAVREPHRSSTGGHVTQRDPSTATGTLHLVTTVSQQLAHAELRLASGATRPLWSIWHSTHTHAVTVLPRRMGPMVHTIIMQPIQLQQQQQQAGAAASQGVQLGTYEEAGWQYELLPAPAIYGKALTSCRVRGMRLPSLTSPADSRALANLCSGDGSRPDVPDSCWLAHESLPENPTCSAAMVGRAAVVSSCLVRRGVLCVGIDPQVALIADMEDRYGDAYLDDELQQQEEAFQQRIWEAKEQERAARVAAVAAAEAAAVGAAVGSTPSSAGEGAAADMHARSKGDAMEMVAPEERAGSHLDEWEHAEMETNQYAQQQAEEEAQRRQAGKLRGGSQAVMIVRPHVHTSAHQHRDTPLVLEGGYTYELQGGAESYRGAWEVCRSQGLQLAGARWVSDLEAVTHLCTHAPGGCWLLSPHHPGYQDTLCVYTAGGGEIADSECSQERSVVCVTGPEGPHFELVSGATTTTTTSRSSTTSGTIFSSYASPGNTGLQLVYEEEGMAYVLMSGEEEYRTAHDVCMDRGVDIAGIDWGADHRAMQALCSDPVFTPHGCWKSRPSGVEGIPASASDESCVHTLGVSGVEIRGPCDVRRSYVCVFMPTSPLLTDDYLEYYMEGDYWWPGGPGAAPARPKPAAGVPVVTAVAADHDVAATSATPTTTTATATYTTLDRLTGHATTTKTTTVTSFSEQAGTGGVAAGVGRVKVSSGTGGGAAASRITIVPCDEGMQDDALLYVYDGAAREDWLENPVSAVAAAEAREVAAIDMVVAATQPDVGAGGHGERADKDDDKDAKRDVTRKVGQRQAGGGGRKGGSSSST